MLAERFFSGTSVGYVPVQYTNVVTMLLQGKLDTGIWNEDDVHIRYSDLSTRAIEDGWADEDTHAVIMARFGDVLTRQVIRTLVDTNRVREIQR